MPGSSLPDGDALNDRATLYGITLDDIDTHFADTVDAIRRLPHRATTRIVLDDSRAIGDYLDAARQVHEVSDVMIELTDDMTKYASAQAYATRVTSAMDALAEFVDIWEIGNEVNGSWNGDSDGAAAKMAAAFDLVKQHGKLASLNFTVGGRDRDMLTWARAHVPDRMKTGLDYVMFSFYANTGQGMDWDRLFAELGELFPTAKLAFGENGTQQEGDQADYSQVHEPFATKATAVRYDYGLTVHHPRYVGGHFWWYFEEEMTPYTVPLWGVLHDAQN